MPRNLALIGILVGTFACGGGDDDAGGAADAAAPDAEPQPDAMSLVMRWYAASDMVIPSTTNHASMLALDIDGDDRPDNLLGGLFAGLVNSARLAPEVTGDAIAAGEVVFLQRVEAQSLVNADTAAVWLRRGVGSGPYEVVPTDGADGELLGHIVGGDLSAGPAAAVIPLVLFPGQEPIWLTAVGARVDASLTAGAWSGGRIGGGLLEAETHRLFPVMAEGFSAAIARDCPDQVCEADSPGERAQQFFDANDNYVISIAEIQGNTLISATIGNPDLDLLDENGDFNPNVDGESDSLSFGFGLTCVSAVVE